MVTPKMKHLALATSAAALFAVSGCAQQPATSSTASAEGHCMGVNACKGHSDCRTASNACGGKNQCKGTGFVSMTKAVCDQLGGKFEG